jgi:hypothetical protein
MKDRASSTQSMPRRTGSMPPLGSSTVTLTVPSFVQDKKKLTMIAAGGLAALVIVLGILGRHQAAAQQPASPRRPRPWTRRPEPIPSPEPPGAREARGQGARSLRPRPRSCRLQAPAADPEPAEARREGREPEAAEPPRAIATKTAEAKPAMPPATLVFAVSPWGEIFVNGKSRGVTPPMKSLKLDPGKYKVEIRNTPFRRTRRAST